MGRRRDVSVSRDRTEPRSRGSGFGHWWPIAVIVLAGALAYANTLHHPFIFDDHQAIVENATIRDLANLPAVFAPEHEAPTAGRPLVNFTFAVNYALGGLNVEGYHLWNVATHLLAALLFFSVLRRTLARQDGWLRDLAAPLACTAAVLWTVHPLNTDAVDYVTQRTELTMGALLLLTLWASIRALDDRARSTTWSVLAVVSCALGMASKESMVTAPVLVVLYDRVFAFPSMRAAWTSRWRLYAGLAATWLVLAALLATSPRTESAGFSSGIAPFLYLLNQAPIITRYFGLALWPHALVHNYGWPTAMSLASALPSLTVLGALLIVTVVACWRAPRLGFLGAWIWITLSPASSVVPIATEVGAERRMYLPLLGVVTLAVIGGAALLRRVHVRAPIAAAAAASIALAAATIARNLDYASPVTLAQVTVARRPTPVARHVLATELLGIGKRDAALEQLRLAVAGAPRARYTLGVELLEGGQTEEGIAMLQSFLAAEPRLKLAASAHEYLGRTYAQRGEWTTAAREFQAMLGLDGNDVSAERLVADALLNAKDFNDAIAHYQRYLQLAPLDFDGFNQMGAALGSSGRLDDALAAFERAEQINPQNGAVERNLAYVLYEKHDLDGARAHAARAVALEPEDESTTALLRLIQRSR